MTKLVGLFTTVMFTLLAAIVYAQNTDKDLIVHFSFDEGKGNITKDVSQNELEGTIFFGYWTEGVIGKALLFKEGTLTVPAFDVDEPQEMTIEFWFKPMENIDDGDRIDIIYRLNDGGRPHFTFNHQGLFFGCYIATQASEFVVRSSHTIFYPQWYYIVLTQDQEKAVLYIDGAVDGSVSTGGPARLDFTKDGMTIGGHETHNRYFNATIDEVKIWNVALTAEEIKKTWDKHTLNKPLLTSANPKIVAKQKQREKIIAEEKKKIIHDCTHNLEVIGKAIKSYHKEHGKYPEYLSDLLPKHLAEWEHLLCPVDKDRDTTIVPLGSDPKVPVSYQYHLHPSRRKGTLETHSILGDAIPLVECLNHIQRDQLQKTISLSFEYKINQLQLIWRYSPEHLYGSVEAAIEVLETGLKRMPKDERFFRYYPTLLELYLKAERKEEAENVINRFKKLMTPNETNHIMYLAGMFRTMNRLDETLQIYKKLEKQTPEDLFVLINIANLYKELGKPDLELEYRKKYTPELKFVGEMLPDFSATALDSKPISIEAYRGKVVLIDFWSMWLEPSIAEIPNVKKLYEKYKDQGFDIIGINLDNDETEVRDFLKEKQIPWRQVFSGKGLSSPIARQYEIKSIPNMWLIDKEGKLITKETSGIKLEKFVVEALK